MCYSAISWFPIKRKVGYIIKEAKKDLAIQITKGKDRERYEAIKITTIKISGTEVINSVVEDLEIKNKNVARKVIKREIVCYAIEIIKY